MTRARTIAGSFTAATLALCLTLSAQDSPPAFRASADSVSVDVSVRQRGRPVAGLTPSDFEILDRGVPQQIADLSYEKLPIDVTVVLDVSESVTGPVLDQLRRAVRQLQQSLTPIDRLRLVTFNLRISRLLDFGASGAATDEAFGQIHPFGGTAVFDAIAVALAGSTSPERRHLVVVFSDGADSHSISDADVLLDVARRTTPTLGIVLASARPPDPFYARLARETGGMVESLGTRAALSSAFQRMLREFRSSYVLHFTPAGVPLSGFHPLDVRVKRADVEVRARSGYTWR